MPRTEAQKETRRRWLRTPNGRAYKRRWKKKYPEKSRRLDQLANYRLRMEVLAAYGNVCTCCGETEPRFLTIDHIGGGGTKKRKSQGGSNFYAWLRRNGFPKDDLQLLCFNCNCAKGCFGWCPHILGG